MSKKISIPDAWDDDWETQADKSRQDESIDPSITKASKAERIAKHAEQNKKIWDSAESTEDFHFLNARNEVPLKTTFKPAVKVLSRKPTPKQIARTDPVTGLSQLTLEDYEDDEDRQGQNSALTPEELKRKAQQEREEKQRRYDEARERLFGSSNNNNPPGGFISVAGSGTSTPGDVTPSRSSSIGAGGEEDNNRRARGRGKAGVGAGAGNRETNRRLESSSPAHRSSRSRTRISSDHHQPGGGKKQLYDPGYDVKPDSVYVQKRTVDLSGSSRTAPASFEEGQQQPIRAPRGPDGSGKGGFGFSGRGRGGA